MRIVGDTFVRSERVPYVPNARTARQPRYSQYRPNVCAKKDVRKTEETVEEEEDKINTT